MLSQIAESTTDILERCRLMTLVLQRYPDRVPEQGVRTRTKGVFTLNESERERHFFISCDETRHCLLRDRIIECIGTSYQPDILSLTLRGNTDHPPPRTRPSKWEWKGELGSPGLGTYPPLPTSPPLLRPDLTGEGGMATCLGYHPPHPTTPSSSPDQTYLGKGVWLPG